MKNRDAFSFGYEIGLLVKTCNRFFLKKIEKDNLPKYLAYIPVTLILMFILFMLFFNLITAVLILVVIIILPGFFISFFGLSGYCKNDDFFKKERSKIEPEKRKYSSTDDIFWRLIRSNNKQVIITKEILTPYEKLLFERLIKEHGRQFSISVQVSLGALVNVDNNIYPFDSEENKNLFGILNRYRIDFVLFSKKTTQVIAIELDDSSHERPERQERDRKLNEIFRQANIPLIRLKHPHQEFNI